MLVTFLVGNGFDISCGLKSSYQDFYKWYSKQPSNTEHIRKLKEELCSRKKSTSENWADFEIGLGKYTASFTPDSVDEFLACYDDAHKAMINYLQSVASTFDIEKISSDSIDILGNSICHFYADLPEKQRQDIMNVIKSKDKGETKVAFISFNYTDILDRIVQRIAEKPYNAWKDANNERKWAVSKSVIHPHGTLEYNPICGVNDISQIENPAFLKISLFDRYLVKAATVNELGELWYSNAHSLISQSQFICVWGMSLGASDASWWKDIYNWLSSDSSRHLILFWHSSTPLDRRSPRLTISKLAAIKDSFLAYAGKSEDVASAYSERIHIVFNTGKVLCIPSDRKQTKDTVTKEIVAVK